ncbi:MAG: hypothetical protein WDO73_17250 [Ignavibacteriota bacterium]
MASLFEAIVMQNLSVLTRGNTLLPVVLLLGGPNCYIKGMRDCWKANIPKIWEERNTPLPEVSRRKISLRLRITRSISPPSARSNSARRKTTTSGSISGTTNSNGTLPWP